MIYVITNTPREPAYLHEKHQLDDRRSSQEFAEGVDKEVKGQQRQLDQQHQRVVTGLEHLRGGMQTIGRHPVHLFFVFKVCPNDVHLVRTRVWS